MQIHRRRWWCCLLDGNGEGREGGRAPLTAISLLLIELVHTVPRYELLVAEVRRLLGERKASRYI